MGTSNCALAFVDLRRPEAESKILALEQWQSESRSITLDLLPSFAYFPREPFPEAGNSAGDAAPGGASALPDGSKPVVGLYARDISAQEPERVIASAKSWLIHAGVDRRARLLPWASREIPEARKLSPVAACALYLNYLKTLWDREMAGGDERTAFNRQHIVITVPASFDQAAQRLTLESARMAGFPAEVRLLEEPQAAFHAWLEKHPESRALRTALGAETGDALGGEKRVLVCDIGGGTTDFSLFSIGFHRDDSAQIRRIAVSDHILLGGDNIDLALARLLESRSGVEGGHLDPRAWQRLVAESRHLKERVLDSLSKDRVFDSNTEYKIGVSESGGNLFTQARTAVVTGKEILALLDEGFFPSVEMGDKLQGAEAGFREMGLPYARDAAITRHLAAFLRGAEGGADGKPRVVDAVLFNGGSLTPLYLQAKLLALIASWQKGQRPVALENRELDLAVARGAARYGSHAALGIKPRILGGTAHAYYLEVAAQEKRDAKYLLCILPLGTETDHVQRIEKLELRLTLNRPVEFRLYHSSRRPKDQTGNIVRYLPGEFKQLPSLHTVARLETDKARALGSADISVGLQALLNNLGLLRVYLVSDDKRLRPAQRWELEFDMRAQGKQEHTDESAAPSESERELSPEAKEKAFTRLSQPYPMGGLRELEEMLGKKRQAWPRSWLRSFWEPHYGWFTRRDISPDYEASWLNAAGFLLRPGYGAPFDDYRMDQLWHVQAVGLAFPRAKAVRMQFWLLWRRVAGGLNAERQIAIYSEARPVLAGNSKQADEAVGMACAFERLPMELRLELLDMLLTGIGHRTEGHLLHYLWALGRLLSRVSLYAGQESVLPPSAVEKAFAYFQDRDWTESRLGYLGTVFVQACRLTNHRALDISPSLRGAVVEKMRSSGVNPQVLRPVTEFIPVEQEDLQTLFGESLPLGLILQQFS